MSFPQALLFALLSFIWLALLIASFNDFMNGVVDRRLLKATVGGAGLVLSVAILIWVLSRWEPAS